MSEWQPIETAPKDGSKFLGLTKDGRAATFKTYISVLTNKHVFAEIEYDSLMPRNPTHWMPLPTPPKASP